MIVRRIRHHIVTHNWFAVTVDLAIVVVGVFLANQVTNWNENRIEGEQTQIFRARLIDELEDNELQYKHQLTYYRQVRAHALAALDALDRPTVEEAAFLVDAYQATQIDPTPGKRFVFDAMVSAGLLRRLGNDRIQETASRYYLEMATREPMIVEDLPYRDLMRQELPYAVQAQIHSRCGDQAINHQGETVGYRLPTSCTPVLPRDQASAAAQQIRAIPELKGSLTRYVASIDQKLRLFEGAISDTQRLKGQLTAQSD